MLYLLLAVLSSCMIAILMRLSTEKVSSRLSMLCMNYVICTLLRKNPTPASNCIGCGKCEKHCPQHLPIREKLGEAQKELEGPLYRTVRKVLGKFAKF